MYIYIYIVLLAVTPMKYVTQLILLLHYSDSLCKFRNVLIRQPDLPSWGTVRCPPSYLVSYCCRHACSVMAVMTVQLLERYVSERLQLRYVQLG